MLPKYENEFNEIRGFIKELSQNILKAYRLELEGFKSRNLSLLDESREILKEIDAKANEVDNKIIKIFALFEPEAGLLRELVAFLKTTNELSRIASSGRNYAKNMKRHIESGVDFTGIEEYMINIHLAAISALEFATDIENSTAEYEKKYTDTLVEENKTDDLFKILEREILKKVCSKNSDASEKYINILNLMRKFERVADHSVNIAKMFLYAKKGGKIEVY